MSFDPRQFRQLTARTLDAEKLYSVEAVELLLGTCAVESRFGTYIRQLGDGPARGPFQIEEATFGWLKAKYKDRVPWIWEREFRALEWDLRLGIVIARLRYLVVPDPLPPAGFVLRMAGYWKDHYNTRAGKGQRSDFVRCYRRYVTEGRR